MPNAPPESSGSAFGSLITLLLLYWMRTRSVAVRPKFSGEYISSALAGGTMNSPGVVDRQTYTYSYAPSHRYEVNASARSSRRFSYSHQWPHHHQPQRLPLGLIFVSWDTLSVPCSSGLRASNPAGN